MMQSEVESEILALRRDVDLKMFGQNYVNPKVGHGVVEVWLLKQTS